MNMVKKFVQNQKIKNCNHALSTYVDKHQVIKENTIEETHIFTCPECGGKGTQLHIIERYITLEREE